MIVVLPVVAVLGTLLLWALYAEQVGPEPERRPLPPWPAEPAPADVAHARFAHTPFGYDPRSVRAHLDRSAEALASMQDRVNALEVLLRSTHATVGPPSDAPEHPSEPDPSDASH